MASGSSLSARRIPQLVWAIAFVCVAIAAPFFVYPTFLMKVMCFALFACAFNLLLGFVGLLSFGHAAYFGIGAYLAAHALKVWELGPLTALIVGTLAGGAGGLVIGWFAIRRHGIYFAMITFAFAQMIYFAAVQLPFTGGEDGLQNVPRRALFGVIDLNQPLALYYFVFAVFLLCFLLIYRTVHSPFGQILKAIRENEPRAISLGFQTQHYKLLAFVLSAALAGTAGALQSLVLQMASLTDIHSLKSAEVILMTLVGGMGSVFGPAIGALGISLIDNYLSGFGSWLTIIQGFIFVLCVLMFRDGIVGTLTRFRPKKVSGWARHLDEVAVDEVAAGSVRPAAARGAAATGRCGCSGEQVTGSVRP